jgi:hypothetical protein
VQLLAGGGEQSGVGEQLIGALVHHPAQPKGVQLVFHVPPDAVHPESGGGALPLHWAGWSIGKQPADQPKGVQLLTQMPLGQGPVAGSGIQPFEQVHTGQEAVPAQVFPQLSVVDVPSHIADEVPPEHQQGSGPGSHSEPQPPLKGPLMSETQLLPLHE